jgi:hypothetical protein
MRKIEQQIVDIFNKSVITERDIIRSRKLFRIWKELAGWREETSNPIQA